MLGALAPTRFGHVEVHATLDSTQRLLVTEGGPDGRVVVADHQTAGRGRVGRTWTDVPGAMLMFSALLRAIPSEHAASMSLVAGLAVARAVGPDVHARLKWPNDVLVAERKLCGVLGELVGDAVVIGIGINVGHAAGDLPDDLGATSLRLVTGEVPRRDDLCVAVLTELDRLIGSEGWLDAYRERCATIGSRVRVELTDRSFEGTATEVRDDGALVVDGRNVVAGDVVHLR